MIVLVIVIGLSALLLLISLGNLIFLPRLESQRTKIIQRKKQPLVSLLVPCRNEEQNIAKLLKSLTSQTYETIQIVLYNDNSTDKTLELLRQEKKKHPSHSIQIINGGKLPKGWVGKNHACFQLAKRAKGKYLCFIDADVRLAPIAIQQLISVHKGGLLSVFPKQIKRSVGEWLIVPLMKWFLLSLLPFQMIQRSPREEIVAANGQLMCFSQEAYMKVGGHKSVASDIVEDMALARRSKRKGVNMQTFISTRLISCRMYNSFRESMRGFSKSFFPGTRLSKTGFALLLFLFALTFFVPFIFISSPLAWIALALLVANKLVVSAIQQEYAEAAFFPAHLVLFVVVGILSVSARRRIWKGRTY